MKNILIIGATGTIGQATRHLLLTKTNYHLTLFARTANQLIINHDRETSISGDLNHKKELLKAMQKQDIVLVALSGYLPKYVQNIINIMQEMKVSRIIFIASMGIYNEIPDNIGASGNLKQNPYLKKYRQAADLIESSSLDYTIIRPGWFDQGTETYEITTKGEAFGGHDIAINSIADFIVKLIIHDAFGIKQNYGINRPNF